jgi:hypothetical protein
VRGARHRRGRTGSLGMAVVGDFQLHELAVGRLLQAAQQMVVLQFEYVLFSVVVVEFDSRFLGGQTCFSRFLFADEGRAG